MLAVWVGNAAALPRTAKTPTTAKKKVVSNLTVLGSVEKCHQWGPLQVRLKVIKTEITGAGKPKVSIKITSADWAIYPDHTPKSVYINAQALPLLQTETLQLQANAGKKLENISGATHTTVSWRDSLQVALAKALKP
jgi:hypothetical protein